MFAFQPTSSYAPVHLFFIHLCLGSPPVDKTVCGQPRMGLAAKDEFWVGVSRFTDDYRRANPRRVFCPDCERIRDGLPPPGLPPPPAPPARKPVKKSRRQLA